MSGTCNIPYKVQRLMDGVGEYRSTEIDLPIPVTVGNSFVSPRTRWMLSIRKAGAGYEWT